MIAVSSQRSPTRIALDKDAVYWRNAGEPTDAGGPLSEVLKLARRKDAATVQLVGDIPGGGGLTIDPDYVYWGTDEPCGAPNLIKRIKKNGGTPLPVLAGCLPLKISELVVDGADVFFASRSGGGEVARAQAGVSSTMAKGASRGLASDTHSIYFGQPSTATLVRIDKGDVNNSVQVFAVGQLVVAVVTDETAVYWITENNTVARLDRDKPGGIPKILAKDQPSPTAIALTATHVLWTNAGDRTVRRIAKTGGTPETIASQQDDPVAIAADEAGIYWLNGRPGTVTRIGW